ncbi:cell division protein FtsZ [Alloalcanivorax xenomutans]|jgi:cell division protein FtsZ|uniref:Cell division protein FtsZ n=1 Tax=Alloalcanivorax xenomutans TaxID=1094342 RepID=A0A9Q3ZDQ3_9GAMM|nr:cell division protein FtsZ [Alloalcanivorax xenomutans]ERS13790.1 peptidase M23 [Alcanivorax sp. PN-3]KYZ84326.1 cell division protein FtsZ [Alcanivorax sp. KX64203]MBA4720419.1 cell division protein FtsZ [Alcanivorax sp.]ARB46803.1 cell division protein FtsZ [Alloalcanivorax xenomutans]MCE7509775.1 cell division protein FtsZ [Alloalcanivorax xenomutans]|eukprot:gnl/TRDRNA2_/TRDRNA2_177393_c0_seq1.p1 gnl/TRDRNA2_/TRDRNA2_177393_c0~~gnl/TRDRNA2_/TRDRNA2_177393_c0_seq1.p1  ORF type:complete len:388 (-),score=79.81 gnl/TRDRNA2_/TRDRNA2_177393_c0_seq1:662-1825(-)
MQFKLEDSVPHGAVIKVVGVGGGGGNAVDHMVRSNVEGVDFICANTDAQALRNSSAKTVIQLGSQVTKGLGAGANPEIGRQAALEDRDRIAELLDGADMVFVTAGMGGGTGTGAAPVVAEIAKELGILTVAVVTKPFPFEGKKRMRSAQEGIQALRDQVHSLITIPNEKLQSVLGGSTTLLDAFKAANEVLQGAVKGIADLIVRPGMINVDFADVRTVMSELGTAMMGTGIATGDNRAAEAAQAAISSPLLEDVDLRGARGILINITANESIALDEFSEVGDIVSELASEEANVIIGTAIDPDMGDNISVTVVATGLGAQQELKVVRGRQNSLGAEGRVDYNDLERPAVERRRAVQQSMGGSGRGAVNTAEDLDFIDIPTFLRRQAD